jgi:hypothetical protein
MAQFACVRSPVRLEAACLYHILRQILLHTIRIKTWLLHLPHFSLKSHKAISEIWGHGIMKISLKIIHLSFCLFVAPFAFSAKASMQTFYTRTGSPVVLSPALIKEISESLHAVPNLLVFYDMGAAYPWLKNGKIFEVRNWDQRKDIQIFIRDQTQVIIENPESLSAVFLSNGALPKPLEVANLIAWAIVQSPSTVMQPSFLDGPCWGRAKIVDRNAVEKQLRNKLDFIVNPDNSWKLEYNVLKGDGSCEHVSVWGKLSPSVVTKLQRIVLAPPGSFPGFNQPADGPIINGQIDDKDIDRINH